MLTKLKKIFAANSKLLNFISLAVGYGMGQGAIFLAQTYLIVQGELDLLAKFGLHFSFATFAIMIVESGSIISLARHVALADHHERDSSHIWGKFSEVSAFRCTLAGLILIAAICTPFFVTLSPFTRNYIYFGLPACFFWALNGAGILDGLKLSGISGLSGSLPHGMSAIALILALNLPEDAAGMVLGSALSIGYLLATVLQLTVLQAIGCKVRLIMPCLANVLIAGREGLSLLGSTLPGQVYFRIQLTISNMWLGADMTALFIYIKQIIVGVAQVTGLVRRVEFPELIRQLKNNPDRPVSTIWQVQIRGTQFAGTAALVIFVLAFAANFFGTDVINSLGKPLMLFSVTTVTGAIILAFSQGLAGLGRYTDLFTRSILMSILGVVLSVMLVPIFGIYAFALADIGAAAISLATIFYLLARMRETR